MTTEPALTFRPRDREYPATSLRSLLVHGARQCHRIVLKWTRDPATLTQSLIYPAILVALFRLVLGDSMTAHSGTDSIYAMVPMVALIGAMSGGSASALGVRRERENGLLGRFWTMPVHRGAVIVGRLAAESLRSLVTACLIFLVGALFGFRIHGGPGALVAMLALVMFYGAAFATVVTAAALLTDRATIVEWIAIATNVMMLFNSGFAPVSVYPEWLQPLVRYQPLSCGVDALRSLALGDPDGAAILALLGWSAALLLLFAGPLARGYRRAALRG